MSYQPVEKTIEEKERDFYHAYSRLIAANKNYDEGDMSASGAIGSCVYALVYDDGKKIPSALTLIGCKSDMLFLDSAGPLTNSDGLTTPMCGCILSSEGFKHFPFCNDGYEKLPAKKNVPFEAWWETPVLGERDSVCFTRKHIVNYFRHEQSSHVSRSYTSKNDKEAQEFADMSRGENIKWVAVDQNGNRRKPVYGPDYPTMRHIGWEVEQSIVNLHLEFLPKYQSQAGVAMRTLEASDQ